LGCWIVLFFEFSTYPITMGFSGNVGQKRLNILPNPAGKFSRIRSLQKARKSTPVSHHTFSVQMTGEQPPEK
jgi:hypothetical protein